MVVYVLNCLRVWTLLVQERIPCYTISIMNRHQILTGACNGGDCYALGSVEGINFVVSSQLVDMWCCCIVKTIWCNIVLGVHWCCCVLYFVNVGSEYCWVLLNQFCKTLSVYFWKLQFYLRPQRGVVTLYIQHLRGNMVVIFVSLSFDHIFHVSFVVMHTFSIIKPKQCIQFVICILGICYTK